MKPTHKHKLESAKPHSECVVLLIHLFLKQNLSETSDRGSISTNSSAQLETIEHKREASYMKFMPLYNSFFARACHSREHLMREARDNWRWLSEREKHGRGVHLFKALHECVCALVAMQTAKILHVARLKNRVTCAAFKWKIRCQQTQ